DEFMNCANWTCETRTTIPSGPRNGAIPPDPAPPLWRVTPRGFNWTDRRIYSPNTHTIRLLDGPAEEVEPRVVSNTHGNDHASSSTDNTASDALSSFSLGKGCGLMMLQSSSANDTLNT
ncbi:hypothetical protein BJ138DRAFT_1106757, partial [Hygrophoropsis aurantiaca]